MIWALDDWDAMTRRIFAEVWVTMRVAYVWPAQVWPAPGHGPGSRDDRYVRPVIRSCIGGRSLDPPHRSAHSLKGAIMRKHTITVSALLLASLTGCAAASTPAAPAPSVTWQAPDVLNLALADADAAATEAHAWEIFDHGGGAAALRVDPSRPYKVVFMSATPGYPSWAGPDDAVIAAKDGRWYWFAVSYTG